MCPECEKLRLEKEKTYREEHGLEEGGGAFTSDSYPYIVKQGEEWVCSECGLLLTEDDLEKLTAEDKRNAEKYVKARNEYIATHKMELYEQWVRDMESIPLEIRQLGEQMADAERQHDLRAGNAKRERAELLRRRPRVHRTEVPNVYVIKKIKIPHPVLAGKTLCIQNASIYIDQDKNRTYVRVNYTADEIDKIGGAGVYDHCYEIHNDHGVLLPIPESVRRTIRGLPRSGRNTDADLSAINLLLFDNEPRTCTEIDRACGWPHSTAKRLVDKRPDLFQVDDGKRRSGKPRRVTLRKKSTSTDQV
jgi:hypothetical protein